MRRGAAHLSRAGGPGRGPGASTGAARRGARGGGGSGGGTLGRAGGRPARRARRRRRLAAAGAGPSPAAPGDDPGGCGAGRRPHPPGLRGYAAARRSSRKWARPAPRLARRPLRRGSRPGRRGATAPAGGGRQRRLRPLHLRLDRPAEGGGQQPPGHRQPAAVDAGGLQPGRGRPVPAEDPVRLRRLGSGILRSPDPRSAVGGGPAGGAPRQRLPGPAGRAGGGHDDPLRALDAPLFPGGGRDGGALPLAAPGAGQRRGPALGGGATLPRHAAGAALQPVWSDRGRGRGDGLELPAGGAPAARGKPAPGADRPADPQHADPPRGPAVGAGAARGGGGAGDRRRAGGARLSRASGPDGGALRPRSVGSPGFPPVPHRRPLPPSARRGDRIPRAARRSGEDPRRPHRAPRDRDRSGNPSGGPRGRGRGASGRRRGAVAPRLRGAGGGGRSRCRDGGRAARGPGRPPAALHGAGHRLRPVARPPSERQARPPISRPLEPRGRDRPRARGVGGAADAARGAAGRPLRRGAGRRPARCGGEFLRARRPLARRHAADRADPRGARHRAAAPPRVRDADRGGPGAGGRG